MILRFSRSIFIAALLAATALPVSAATHKKKSTKHTDSPKHSDSSKQAEPAEQPVTLTPVEATTGGIPLTRAASVLVVDARTAQILYQKTADEQRPPASTQKLLTALLIVEAGNLDRKVTVQTSDTQAEPVKLYIKAGEIYTRRELLQVLLVHSTNDVARCLARDNAGSLDAFADKMNRKALELGMRHSNFVNPNGLPAPGQHSTARDMAKLAQAAYQSSTIRSIVSMKTVTFTYADGRVREFKNTNRVLRGYPYCNGMKTGYTEAAGHCLISSGSNNGREVIVVVLGDNQQVWRDSYSLLAWGLSL